MCMTTLFVYGTLKWGYWNHETYCGSAISIEEATVRGRLYELSSGIPVLAVPDEEILLVGTSDLYADTQAQERAAQTGSATGPDFDSHWDTVRGELITLHDPLVTLARLDRLEGFSPGRATLYKRVLLCPSTDSESNQVAWCYVLGTQLPRDAVSLGRISWT